MTTENLKQTLLELHAALDKAGPLDPELVQLLKVLDQDIQSKLGTPAMTVPAVSAVSAVSPVAPQHALQQEVAPLPSAVPEDDGLTSRAQALSARFAAQHPHLEPVLRELTDTLQRIGI